MLCLKRKERREGRSKVRRGGEMRHTSCIVNYGSGTWELLRVPENGVDTEPEMTKEGKPNPEDSIEFLDQAVSEFNYIS